jgi:hypothetical protein
VGNYGWRHGCEVRIENSYEKCPFVLRTPLREFRPRLVGSSHALDHCGRSNSIPMGCVIFASIQLIRAIEGVVVRRLVPPKNLIWSISSSKPVVSVMQSADLGHRNDAAERRRCDGTTTGRILLKR